MLDFWVSSCVQYFTAELNEKLGKRRIVVEERGLIGAPEELWQKAKEQADVIGRLAKQTTVSLTDADEAAALLGISQRQVYKLVKRYRSGEGLVTDLLPRRSGGGKGTSRINPDVSKVIAVVLEELYLTRQKRSESSVVREIWMRCKEAGLAIPARNTIRARIRAIDPLVAAKKRHGQDVARTLTAAAGKTPESAGPLDVVQMDHTPMDVIVVDELSREPIGRPYLTLAIDTFTRCIVGMLLTLEAPSATSVGLCLAHTVADKTAWLARLGLVDMTWPMHGKPGLIFIDNAPEFKSEALKRGCEQHSIKRDYRPKGQPHFGGIIERVIGTAMKMAHELPGTTFSNTMERGKYNSEAAATLTLQELEKWLALAIGVYHESVHGSLMEPPAACWRKSLQSRKIYTVKNEKAFLIDFLPVVRREVTRIGFLIDHITYFADNLKPWIARRGNLDKFIIRRDPRDLSRIWVLDPESKCYLEIPYRSCSNPAVTLWEHRKAVARLRERGREQVNEVEIFRMITKMREITGTAASERKKARRDQARRGHLPELSKEAKLLPPADLALAESQRVKPFDDIEEWS
jgi:putative transposase